MAQAIHTHPVTRSHSRIGSIGLWALQVLTAAMFVFAAVPKLSMAPATVESAQVLGVGIWFLVAIGILETLGAIAMFIPILTGLAAKCFVALMVGAFLTQVIYFNGFAWFMPVIGLALVAPIAWGRRDQTRRLFTLLLRR